VATLSFRGQRVFLHNASGWFGDAPVEASGDFGLNPDDGEFHLMCQVSWSFLSIVYRYCHIQNLSKKQC
jgi:hypothetical protein